VHLPEFIWSTTFRWALGIAAAFGVCTMLLFGFVYWRTAAYVTDNIDSDITTAARLEAGSTREQALGFIAARLHEDPHRLKLAGLFAPDGHRVGGNVEAIPNTLPLDGQAHVTEMVRIDDGGREPLVVRAVGLPLDLGDVIVVGRDMAELREVGEIVAHALLAGLLPALCLALFTGIWLSRRAQRRIDRMNERVQRIIAGELQERLPLGGADDPLDRLAKIVNGMLDQIEQLVNELAGVGDNIAHDLRTPLTRVRAVLERGRASAGTLEDLSMATERAIVGLDQSLAIITALLRIAELDHGRRSAGMGMVQLPDLLREVQELYHPIAEDKGVSLCLDLGDAGAVSGDRDLLLEAIANLVDNAIKFTPAGGSVTLRLVQQAAGPAVQVEDTGPGISAAEREVVFKRFYRSDKSRHTAGTGLGLSLVSAIARLHGFRLAILDGPGCRIEIACHPAQDYGGTYQSATGSA
jgi:signal transduction histidine kinase